VRRTCILYSHVARVSLIGELLSGTAGRQTSRGSCREKRTATAKSAKIQRR
jgi:hypothetical protein